MAPTKEMYLQITQAVIAGDRLDDRMDRMVDLKSGNDQQHLELTWAVPQRKQSSQMQHPSAAMEGVASYQDTEELPHMWRELTRDQQYKAFEASLLIHQMDMKSAVIITKAKQCQPTYPIGLPVMQP